MQDEIMVSVVCTAYNHELYIRDCLEGFVNQKTNFKYEVIVHDDASTDKTADIIREYEEKYPDIIKPIYQTENQYSQNIAIGKKYIYPRAKGKYIAFCEGDDYWCDTHKLQKQVDFLEMHPDFSACVHNSYRLNCQSNIKTLYNTQTNDYDISMSEIIENWGCIYQTSSLICKKQFCLMPKEFITKSFGDYPRAIYLSTCGKIHFLKDVMSIYRFFAQGSWSETKLKGGIQAENEHHLEMIPLLKQMNEYTQFQFQSSFQKMIDLNEEELLENESEFRKIALNKRYRIIFIRKNVVKNTCILIISLFAPTALKKHFKKRVQQ